MTEGENQWTKSTRKQIARLTSLTEKLVFLSRMDEEATTLGMQNFAISDAVKYSTDGWTNPHFFPQCRTQSHPSGVEYNGFHFGWPARRIVRALLPRRQIPQPENRWVWHRTLCCLCDCKCAQRKNYRSQR